MKTFRKLTTQENECLKESAIDYISLAFVMVGLTGLIFIGSLVFFILPGIDNTGLFYALTIIGVIWTIMVKFVGRAIVEFLTRAPIIVIERVDTSEVSLPRNVLKTIVKNIGNHLAYAVNIAYVIRDIENKEINQSDKCLPSGVLLEPGKNTYFNIPIPNVKNGQEYTAFIQPYSKETQGKSSTIKFAVP
ncbi:MAG: hypothetical protein HY515_00240 [Candidatus Aenigmarchaeota archaeon]|nr:hypothetical protein [Candidatus Aenigmarchaeota archaeon]